MMAIQRRNRDESGAYAIMFALLVTFIMIVAAFAIDIGNAVARKSDVQAQADFAALAGARELGSGAGGTIPAAVVDAARDYLNNNSPLNQDCAPGCVTSAQLTDCPAAPTSPFTCYVNGEVLWAKDYAAAATPKKCGPSGLCVITPREQVDYGLAQIVGISGTQVQGGATVGIFSPGRSLPFYVSESCSHLQQTIVDPAPGQDEPIPPDLDPDSPAVGDPNYEGVRLDSITPSEIPLGVDPGDIDIITVNNSGADGITEVWFSREPIGTGPTHEQATIVGTPAGDLVTVQIPASVYTTEALWYVRVKKAVGLSEDTLTFKVGSPPLYCEGFLNGNFGALNLSRNDSQHGDWIALNTALGIQHHLGVMSPAQTPCENTSGAVMAPTPPDPGLVGINCMLTEPGRVQQATEGFITGARSQKGLLDVTNPESRNTLSGCNGGTNQTVTLNGNRQFVLNNEVLTCFITSPTASVGDVSQKGVGAPDNVISDAIFDSPRFFYLPVLANDPTGGRSGSWPIIEFRAAFLTGQPNCATSTDPMRSDTNAAANGLILDGNAVEKVRVVLLNEESMPDTANTDVLSPFRGSGIRIIRLID